MNGWNENLVLGVRKTWFIEKQKPGTQVPSAKQEVHPFHYYRATRTASEEGEEDENEEFNPAQNHTRSSDIRG